MISRSQYLLQKWGRPRIRFNVESRDIRYLLYLKSAVELDEKQYELSVCVGAAIFSTTEITGYGAGLLTLSSVVSVRPCRHVNLRVLINLWDLLINDINARSITPSLRYFGSRLIPWCWLDSDMEIVTVLPTHAKRPWETPDAPSAVLIFQTTQWNASNRTCSPHFAKEEPI